MDQDRTQFPDMLVAFVSRNSLDSSGTEVGSEAGQM